MFFASNRSTVLEKGIKWQKRVSTRLYCGKRSGGGHKQERRDALEEIVRRNAKLLLARGQEVTNVLLSFQNIHP